MMNIDHKTTHPGPVKPIPTIIPSPVKYQVAGDAGHTTLWVVFVLMVIAAASFAGLSWKVPVSRRIYHVAVTLASIIGAISYFAMATGQGVTLRCGAMDHSHGHGHWLGYGHGHDHGHRGSGVCREVYWSRYVDWAVSTPMLLLGLCLLAGVNGAHTLMAVAADLVMKFAGLFGALGKRHGGQRWGWYVIAWIAYIFVIWHVAVHGSRTVKARGTNVARVFGSLALYALVLWTIYPIIWGLAGSSRVMNVDAEIITYAVLDVLAKAGFGVWLLACLRRVPETNVDLDGYWSNGMGAGEGTIRLNDDEEGA